MKLLVNSGLFSVTPPCCYWVFQDYLYELERQETEYRAELAEESVKITEQGQPWLCGLDRKVFDGKTAYRLIQRKDLPEDHPEYAGEEQVDLDWTKAKAIISQAWLDVFEERIKDKYYELGRDNPIKVRYVETYSPREYNFSHDNTGFALSIPKTEMNKIVREVLEGEREGFSGYLHKYHSSYDGFWSYMSNNVTDYDDCWERFKKGGRSFINDCAQRHLLWAVLDYWLFPTQEDRDRFDTDLWSKVADYEGNGEFSNCMTYSPVETERVA
jgi:hypothetical protein